MSNSKLVSYKKISPNRTSPRNHTIDTITIHCMAAPLSVETCGNVFASPSRNASSNYGIGPDGRIGLYVEEKDRSWATSNRANDNRAITIEVACESKHPYKVTEKAYESLIELLVDICKRNKINKLLWKGDKSLIGNVSKQNMTVHRWFANKACPGDYLYNKHDDIAKAVNKKLGSKNSIEPVSKPSKPVPEGTPDSFEVEILTEILNVRTGPGTKYAQVKTVSRGKRVHISATYDGWGKLKSGSGWISLSSKYTKKIEKTDKPQKEVTVPKFEKGKEYKLTSELNVRTGAGIKYSKKTYYQLSASGKGHDKDKDGALEKGTVVTCQETKVINKNEVWMRCPSGWIAACYKGKLNVKINNK